MAKGKVKAYIGMQMVMNLKDNGKMMRNIMGNINIQMEIYFKVSSKREKCHMVLWPIKTDKDMKDNLQMD